MLDMAAHLQSCPHCADECRAVQQVRLVLRALPTHIPRQTLEARMTADATRPSPFFTTTDVRLPRRGQRLARTLALSALGLLTFAAPFAPAAFDGGYLPSLRPSRPAAPVPGTVFVEDIGTSAASVPTLVRLSPVPPPLTVNSLSRAGMVSVPASRVQNGQARSLPLSVWGTPDPLQTPGGDGYRPVAGRVSYAVVCLPL